METTELTKVEWEAIGESWPPEVGQELDTDRIDFVSGIYEVVEVREYAVEVVYIRHPVLGG